jgi:hypothetical protein
MQIASERVASQPARSTVQVRQRTGFAWQLPDFVKGALIGGIVVLSVWLLLLS